MKTLSTFIIFLLLQSSSSFATQARHYLQSRWIAHF